MKMKQLTVAMITLLLTASCSEKHKITLSGIRIFPWKNVSTTYYPD